MGIEYSPRKKRSMARRKAEEKKLEEDRWASLASEVVVTNPQKDGVASLPKGQDES